MFARSLRLYEFRNFARAQIELSSGVNFFVGANGQGKTNLLEAVHLLARGRSFRPVHAASYPRRGDDGAAPQAKIAAAFARENYQDEAELVFAAGKRSATLNGKRAAAADLMRAIPIVLFSPESLAAIKEGPEQRRALIDDLVLTEAPHQAQLLHEHGRCLRARNRVLKDLAKGIGDAAGLEMTLLSLDKIYFLLCTHVTEARLQALRSVLSDFRQAMAFISGAETGDISVDYVISEQSALAWGEAEIYDALQKRHRELARQEISAGASLVGPHKHDIKFLFCGNDSRFFCSQGQQRALILSLKIAQIVYHHRVHQTYPILLLDDVLSELDAQKRISLMKFLDGVSAQILITATDPAWPDQFSRADSGVGSEGQSSIFAVDAGRVARLST